MVSESSTGDPETTHLDGADGLWIPPELREFTAQIVIRTPTTTIQHFQSGGGELEAYYGMVGASHFGDVDEMHEPRNPELAPNQVSIKPQGEEAVVLEVEPGPFMDDEEADRLRTDGGCSETVVACPECDRASVHNNTTPGRARGRDDVDQYQCQACKATFDEPVERERRREGYIRSDCPARQLDDMNPDDLDEVLQS